MYSQALQLQSEDLGKLPHIFASSATYFILYYQIQCVSLCLCYIVNNLAVKISLIFKFITLLYYKLICILNKTKYFEFHVFFSSY